MMFGLADLCCAVNGMTGIKTDDSFLTEMRFVAIQYPSFMIQ